MTVSSGRRRQILTIMNKNQDLAYNVSSSDPTAKLLTYVKVGKFPANAASYDALITLNDVRNFVLMYKKMLDAHAVNNVQT